MQREIKFRVWDRILNEMMPWEVVKNNSFAYYEKVNESYNSMTIEQYTGLKDKDGVEIYEGDIVKFDSYVTDFSIAAEVIYIEKFASFAFSTEKIDYHPSNEYIVIGNIHENPELLEVALMLDLRTDFSLPCKLIAEEHFLYDSIFTRI